MALIKDASAREAARHAVVLNMGDVKREAMAVRSAADQAAREIVAQAQQERTRLTATAAQEGFAKGHAEGLARGLEEGRIAGRKEAIEASKKEIGALLAAWRSALEAFEASRASMLGDLQEDVLRFACELASRVTHRVVDIDPKVVERQLEAALALVTDPSRLTVAVHPEDEPLVDLVLPAMVAALHNAGSARLVTDSTQLRGSCVIRSERGAVDAGVRAQIARLVDAVLPGEGEAIARAGERLPESQTTEAPETAPDGGAEPGAQSGSAQP